MGWESSFCSGSTVSSLTKSVQVLFDHLESVLQKEFTEVIFCVLFDSDAVLFREKKGLI